MLEFWAGKALVTFDGSVVEVHLRGSDRYHVTKINKVQVREKKGNRSISILAGTSGGLGGGALTPESLAVVNQMIEEINRARVERYGMAPIESSIE